jgi:redox-regulated HSP33 family molecular chaperone
VLPLILGVPYVSLQFVSGSPIGQGISSFFLQSGQTYTGPSLTVGLTAYYSAALASTLIVQVAVTATLSVAATPNP